MVRLSFLGEQILIDRESSCHALIVLWRIVTTGAVFVGVWRRRFLKRMSGLSRRRPK
jgi:hypothetical protein